MDEKYYRLVSAGRKRVVESPFCLCGERIAGELADFVRACLARV